MWACDMMSVVLLVFALPVLLHLVGTPAATEAVSVLCLLAKTFSFARDDDDDSAKV